MSVFCCNCGFFGLSLNCSCVFVKVWRGLSSSPSAPVPVVGPDQPHSAPGLPVLLGPSPHLPLPPALTLHEVRPLPCFTLPFFDYSPEGTRQGLNIVGPVISYCGFVSIRMIKDSHVSEKVSLLNTNKASVYCCVGRGRSFDAAQQSSQESSSSQYPEICLRGSLKWWLGVTM